MPLHYHEHVTPAVLRGHIPGLLRMAAPAADLQAAALPERVERESLVGTERLAFGRLDRSGCLVEEAPEEFPKRALADEADAGAVRLVEDGQAGAAIRSSRGTWPRRTAGATCSW